ncbi:MAG TPA: prolyl oligopeptidase family serine peptidase, partial [Longimicrobiales bacterium]|nr:prolyl oligopeptidase family serine peptidase [Longimicrobiales bacterium]
SMEIGDARHAVVVRYLTIFEMVIHVLMEGELVVLDTPADAQTFVSGDQLVVRTVSPWTVDDATYAPATVLAMDVHAFLAGDRDFRVVASSEGRRVVQGAAPTEDYLLVSVLDDVQGELWRYRLVDGAWEGERLPAPEMGSVSVVATEDDSNRFFFTYSGFTRPATLFLAEADGSTREIRSTPAQFDADGLTVEQHRATSADGTEIPFFIVHREGMEHDGSNPTLLTAYGGFQIPRTASYDAIAGKAWMERGGVWVLANIRGGGEFGPDWWRAALRENRQRAYDDFLAVAEYLVEHGVTSPDHLGIMGGSNGGLLVGAAMTQRPDLFDAVVVQVPLLDMRRYHRLLAGASWMAEYGDPDDPDDWAFIREYSPYHNVREDVEYPRALFTTTTRDDRVHPGHARKMAAKMTDMGHDVLYYENTEGGHGAGVTPEQRARMFALTYSYLWRMLGEERPRMEPPKRSSTLVGGPTVTP